MSYEQRVITLGSGLRVLLVPRKDSLSATAMMIVGVGARYENKDNSGISHFIEHNVFKGTHKRNNHTKIITDIESSGGLLDAATGHEYTYFWVKSAEENFIKVLDVVMDISHNMTFPKKDIEIERGNVIEEIRLYEDMPMRKALTDFMSLVYKDHPLGRKISGTVDTVKALERENLVSFVDKMYTNDRKVLILSGNFNEKETLALVEQYEKGFRNTGEWTAPDPYVKVQTKTQYKLVSKDTKQAHLCVGVKTGGRSDVNRYAQELLSVVLGQGMSSRLFLHIREELGLAYYVGSDNWDFDETGLFFARAGVDISRLSEAIAALKHEFKRLTFESIDDGELEKAKAYLTGKTLLGVETSDELSQWYGFQMLLEKEVVSPKEYVERIKALTSSDLKKSAQQIITEETMNWFVLGPVKNAPEFKGMVGAW